jgi:uncharacterized circularly permuted ATP-grasp superfamily protein/uncharacterized alpha-E superfamily protein
MSSARSYQEQVLEYLNRDYDEMVATGGEMKAPWMPVGQWLKTLTPEQAAATGAEVRRHLRENGVTYSVHGDPGGEHRAWLLDALPWILSEADWQHVEQGLIQRAELMDSILRDLYGDQTLIRDGWLPPEMIHAHHGFLRPCCGMSVPGPRQLILYAADLARGPDGRMWVVNDRTQAPSGTGYVVENRGVMTRTHQRLFNRTGVRRIASFFRTLRQTLESFTPVGGGKDPRVVILTPGPQNETYFEHAFLASYLGYTLVQGDDLTVRDGRVWLRSLGGLEAVDVIIRRVDSWFSDPLELKEDSQLGVAGLMEAIRAGNVLVVNHPGSSVLENPGLMAFLPGICQHLRGEDLLLPSAATWWCGEVSARERVIEEMDRMVIKSIHRKPTFGTVFGADLTPAQKEQLKKQILTTPESFVGQEQVSFSTVPSMGPEQLEARRGVIRGFVTAAHDGSYVVMPGGLARVASGPDEVVVSSQLGGVSKDVWVQGKEKEPFVSLWTDAGGGEVHHDARQVPSRAGENLYWVGRYAERAEGSARLLRRSVMIFIEQLGEDEAQLARHREILMGGLLGVMDVAPIHADEDAAIVPDELEILSLLGDRSRIGSLPFSLACFRNAAFAVRDLWSPDSWRVIEEVIREWGDERKMPKHLLDAQSAQLNRLILHLTALLGLNLESMTRDAGWRLLDSGRRIERANYILAVLRNFLVEARSPDEERLLMETVLAATDSLVTYRKRYRTHPRIDLVLELLLLEPNNARSLLYQIERLAMNIDGLPMQSKAARLTREQRLLVDASSRLRLVEISKIAGTPGQRRRHLELFLDQMLNRVSSLSDALTLTYFRHAERPQYLHG